MNSQFSQLDDHVVQRPNSFEERTIYELRSIAADMRRYTDSQATPAGFFDVDFYIGGNIEPLPIERDLGFVAHALLVDNITSQWVFCDSVRRYFPPYTVGWVVPIPSGAQKAHLRVLQPLGTKAYPAVTGEHGWAGFSEAYLKPAVGIQLPDRMITGVPA